MRKPTEDGGTYRRRRAGRASVGASDSGPECVASSSSSGSSCRFDSVSSPTADAGSMPVASGSTGCSTPVGYRSRGEILRLPSPAGPMSWRRSHSTSFFLASAYITSGFARKAASRRRGVADNAARAEDQQKISRSTDGPGYQRVDPGRRLRGPARDSGARSFECRSTPRSCHPWTVRSVPRRTRNRRRSPTSCLPRTS